MTRCKFYLNNESPEHGFSLARDGYFLGIGSIHGDSVAIVLDKHTLKLGTTFLDFVQFIDTPTEHLIEQLTLSVKNILPKKYADDIEVAITETFTKYGSN